MTRDWWADRIRQVAVALRSLAVLRDLAAQWIDLCDDPDPEPEPDP